MKDSKAPRLVLLAVAAFVVAGCGAKTPIVGSETPNAPPETEVVGTPPVLGQTSANVEFFWTGSDPDGEVVGFEWRISDNGPDGVVDPQDTLTALLPWRHTTANDSLFSVSADLDSFEVDVEDPNQSPRTYRYWRSHTFFIRAVDHEGGRDPSPAQVSFTAVTLAPTVDIQRPERRADITCRSVARAVSFAWEGHDPEAFDLGPVAYRYLLIPVANGQCLLRGEYRQAEPPLIRADDPRWSPWIPADAPGDSGRSFRTPLLDLDWSFLFAVQAKDMAGAVTPTFEWSKNVLHFRTTGTKAPTLRVCETFLGCRTFTGKNDQASFNLVARQPLEFSWEGDANDYSGQIVAYRYGWNVVDPEDPNDPGWEVAWGNGPLWRSSRPRSFEQGGPNLVIRVRDDSGNESQAIFSLAVVRTPSRSEQRPLLIVDDWPEPGSEDLESIWQSDWLSLGGDVREFRTDDYLDAVAERGRLTYETVAGYKAVVWFTGPSEYSFLHANLAPASLKVPRYNWLQAYQAQTGNLLLVGPGAAQRSVEGRHWILPIIFNTPLGDKLGFGTERRPDGSEFNRGTLRWPYSGWCLEAVDYVRPGINFIFGEDSGNIRRTRKCDQLVRAVVADDLYRDYPDAIGRVVDLNPRPVRLELGQYHKFDYEEFYNANTTVRRETLFLRPCQTPMFRHVARRELGLVEDPKTNCLPRHREESLLQGVPVAVVSRVYSQRKPLMGSEDFLWGFHPHAFELEDVRSALRWILESRWGLPLAR